jgi:hypothetical protein
MMKKSEFRRILREARVGYGFDPIEQTPEGLFCTGCNTVHKRPTKMYKGGAGNAEIMCNVAIVHFYNPEETP